MREIKIKVWDKRKKQMLPSSSIWKCDFRKYNTGDFTIVLFTGQKDKNGKEIYAGWIVKEVGTENIAVIEFKDGSFIYKWINVLGGVEYTYMHGIQSDYKFVTIGNIYENRELLNEN